MDAKGRATIKAFADKEAAAKNSRPALAVSSAGTCYDRRTGDALRFLRPGGVSRRRLWRKVWDHARARLLHALFDGVAARLKQDIEVEAKDGLTAN